MGFEIHVLIWIAYFVFAWFGYLISRSIVNILKRKEEKKCSHFYPLVIGFTYAPIFFGMTKIIKEEGILAILAVAVPPFIVALAMRFVPPQKKTPEPVEIANT